MPSIVSYRQILAAARSELATVMGAGRSGRAVIDELIAAYQPKHPWVVNRIVTTEPRLVYLVVGGEPAAPEIVDSAIRRLLKGDLEAAMRGMPTPGLPACA